MEAMDKIVPTNRYKSVRNCNGKVVETCCSKTWVVLLLAARRGRVWLEEDVTGCGCFREVAGVGGKPKKIACGGKSERSFQSSSWDG